MNRNHWSGNFQIKGRLYGGSHSAYIIAEIGSNHAGQLKRAKEFIVACAQAGANAVKFQSWSAPKIQNIKDVGADGSLQDAKAIPILTKYEVPDEWHGELAGFCQEQGVDFLSTPFDLDKARLLRSIQVPAIKIASGDLTYDQLLKEVGQYDLPILLSTGMANLGEIERALELLEQSDQRDIVLLHCTAAYPPDLKDANLLTIRTLRDTFDLPVGISDHFPGHDTILAAIALGASVVEKHVTFSRADGHPDSPFALEIPEFQAMVASIRSLEIALGNGKKCCMPSELGGQIGGRRCLFAARDLVVGQTLTLEDVAVVRPNIGELKPHHLDQVLGSRIKETIPAGTPLKWDYLERL